MTIWWRCRRTGKQAFSVFIGLFVLFGMITIQAEPFVNRAMFERLQETYGERAAERGRQLNHLLESLKNKSTKEKLLGVNRFFNRFSHEADIDLWKESDYWATPEEFLGHYAGDCEDYVVAKYFALRYLGIEDERLYLTYVKALKQNVAHMVLTYFEKPQGIPLVLDNYDLRILPADKRTDLLPVYSFNAKSLFLTNASAGLGRSLPTDKVKNSKWTHLLKALSEADK